MAAFEKVGSAIAVASVAGEVLTNPVITGLSGGGFVVIWRDGVPGPNFSELGSSVQAQIYDSNGVKSGGVFALEPEAPRYFAFPAIHALGNGGFVASWNDVTSSNTAYEAVTQVYSANGSAVGSKNIRDGSSVSVVGLADGHYVEGWFNYADQKERLQIFDESGVASGPVIETQAGSGLTLAALANGGFVASWTGSDANQTGVKAQLFDAKGEDVSTVLSVNTATRHEQGPSAVTGLADGGFVVTWQDWSNGIGGTSGDADRTAVKAQVYDAAGIRMGGEILVNTTIVADQYDPTITALTNGDFVVTWTDTSATRTGGQAVVKAQLFDPGGAKIEGEFLVSSTPHGADDSEIAALANGGFAVTWTEFQNRNFTVEAQVFGSTLRDAPLRTGAQASLAHGSEDIPYTVTATQLLTGFADGAGGSLALGTVYASNGTILTDHDGIFTVMPDADFNGTERLYYTVTNDSGGALSATLGYVIDAVNDAPTAADQSLDVYGNHAATIDLDMLLAGSADVDGDTLSLAGFGAASHGAVAADPHGGIRYSPDNGFLGRDSFTYVLADGHGGQVSATVNVTVTFTNDYDFSRSGAGEQLSLAGSSDAHSIIGSAYGDLFTGGSGRDMISGGAGSDLLRGGAGNDVLDGGGGRDRLYGGTGDDVFRFDHAADSGAGSQARDVIYDFDVKTDLLDLTGVSASSVSLVDHYTGSDMQVRQQISNSGWTLLSVDTNGDMKTDMQINIHTGGSLLTAADFLVL